MEPSGPRIANPVPQTLRNVAGAADWKLTPIRPSTTSDFLPAVCIFGSMRFPVPVEARMLFAALQVATFGALYLVVMTAAKLTN